MIFSVKKMLYKQKKDSPDELSFLLKLKMPVPMDCHFERIF